MEAACAVASRAEHMADSLILLLCVHGNTIAGIYIGADRLLPPFRGCLQPEAKAFGCIRRLFMGLSGFITLVITGFSGILSMLIQCIPDNHAVGRPDKAEGPNHAFNPFSVFFSLLF